MRHASPSPTRILLSFHLSYVDFFSSFLSSLFSITISPLTMFSFFNMWKNGLGWLWSFYFYFDIYFISLRFFFCRVVVKRCEESTTTWTDRMNQDSNCSAVDRNGRLFMAVCPSRLRSQRNADPTTLGTVPDVRCTSVLASLYSLLPLLFRVGIRIGWDGMFVLMSIVIVIVISPCPSVSYRWMWYVMQGFKSLVLGAEDVDERWTRREQDRPEWPNDGRTENMEFLRLFLVSFSFLFFFLCIFLCICLFFVIVIPTHPPIPASRHSTSHPAHLPTQPNPTKNKSILLPVNIRAVVVKPLPTSPSSLSSSSFRHHHRRHNVVFSITTAHVVIAVIVIDNK